MIDSQIEVVNTRTKKPFIYSIRFPGSLRGKIGKRPLAGCADRKIHRECPEVLGSTHLKKIGFVSPDEQNRECVNLISRVQLIALRQQQANCVNLKKIDGPFHFDEIELFTHVVLTLLSGLPCRACENEGNKRYIRRRKKIHTAPENIFRFFPRTFHKNIRYVEEFTLEKLTE